MKNLAFCIALLCSVLTVRAQMGPGQATPTAIDPTDPKGNPVGADVNLFTGTLNLSYEFGKVATLSGLSFPIRLEYTGNSMLAYEAEHNSGIPYGEGWRLADAGITVETYAYDFLQNELPTDGQLREVFTLDQSRQKGKLYWTNARLRLPPMTGQAGGISGRLVYKYPKKNSTSASVYHLHAFETYVEAVFDGQKWEVTLPDGTIYVFSIRQFRHRNASQVTAHLASNFAETIRPQVEVAEWHLSEIHNPNHANGQKIVFEYELFGQFNHHTELDQTHVLDTLLRHREVVGYIPCAQGMAPCDSLQGGTLDIGDPVPLYSNPIDRFAKTYTDVFLKSVTALDALGQESGRAELKYKSFRPEHELPPLELERGRFLLLNDPQVRRQDSLYSRKVVWFQGKDDPVAQILLDRPAVADVDFHADWQRYQHPVAHLNPLSRFQPQPLDHNPYIASYPMASGPFSALNPSWNYWASRDASGNPGHPLNFNHSVLESPRIQGGNLLQMPPGDLYELRTQVDIPNGIDSHDMNFDVRIATGMEHDQLPFYGLSGPNKVTAVEAGLRYTFWPAAINGPSGYFETGYELFSTRRNIVKWNPAYQSYATRMVSRNLFKLQNLPNEFGGFVVQIGPGADNLHHGQLGGGGTGYYHRYNNFLNTATTASDSFQLDMGTWFGTGAPLEPLFRTERFGMRLDTVPFQKGLVGNRWLFWFLNPTATYNSNSMAVSGANQPTAVTVEHLRNPVPTGNFSLSGSANMHAAHTTKDTKLRTIEIDRISKNPYMLDSVIFFIQDGPVDTYGRVRVKAFKVNHQIQQVPVLNNVNPAWPQSSLSQPYRIISSDTLRRNIFQLESVERLPVDTVGNVRAPSDWTGTKFIYHNDDPATVELNEALLIKSVYNELGGRTDFLYDLPNAQKRRLNENVVRLSHDQSHDVIGRGDAEEIRVPVKARIVQDGQGGRRTDYAFFQPVFMKRGAAINAHFGPGYNTISKSDITWGYAKAIVYEPALNSWSGRARTEHYYRTASANYSDSLLFGRLMESRQFDAQGQLRNKTEIAEKVQMAYQSGFFYHNPPTGLDNGHLVEAVQTRIESMDLHFGQHFSQRRSYQIQKEEVKSTEFDPVTGNSIGKRTTWGYYDWENGVDVGGEYAEMYQSSAWMNNNPLQWTPYYDNVGQHFTYAQEPSWQIAWERNESDDLPGAYTETHWYFLWDIEPFLTGFGTYAGRFAGSFRPYYLCKKYGIRNAAYEVRSETWNGDQDEQPLALSTYHHYETFRDVPGDFIMDIDSSGYGNLCDTGDDMGFQRGMRHAVMYCFGEGSPVERERMVNEFLDDPRYVQDQNGQWWKFPVESVSVMPFSSFNSMPDGMTPSPDERCEAGFVLGPDSKIKYFGALATSSGTFASGSRILCDRYFGCETDSAKARDRVSLLASLPHQHGDSLCDKVHGFPTVQAANDSLFDSIPSGARQNFFDRLVQQFHLRASYIQADTLPNAYLTQDPHNPDFPSIHMLWDTVAGAPNHEGTTYRWEFKPPFPTIRTRMVHERNMHGQVVDESDARHLHTVYEYAHGRFRYWFDSCGIAFTEMYRRHYALPLSVTVTDFAAIEQTTHFGWHPTGAMKSRTLPNGEYDAFVYDERGRLVEHALNGKKRESYAYGIWGGDVSDTWARRTQLNFSEATVYRDNLLPRHKTLTYADPTGKLVQGIAAEYKPAGWQKAFTGTHGVDKWGRTVWTERPQVKYGQSNLDFDPALPSTARRYTVYEDAHSSRVLKSANYGNALNGPHVVEDAYSIISLSDFQFETGASNAEIAELFPFYSGTGGLPKINLHRTFSEDEDDRKGATYTDAGGRTVASLDYDGGQGDERVLTLFVSDAGGRTVKVIDPMKKATTSKYNVLGWAYETETPDGGRTWMQYNQAGDLRVVQDEVRRKEGRYLINRFDRLGRVLEEYTDEIPTRQIGASVLLDSLYFSFSNIYDFSSILTVIDELQLSVEDENFDLSLFNGVNSQWAFPHLQVNKVSPSYISRHRYDHGLDTAFADLPEPPTGAIHPSAQAIVSNQEGLNGRSSLSMTYDGGDLVQMSWADYDEEGNLAWLLRQFNPRGVTPGDRGRVDQVRYPEYDLQGAVKRVEVDLRADLVPDFAQAFDYDGWGRLHRVYVNVGGADHLAADYKYADATGNLEKVRYYANGAGSPVSLLADSIAYLRDVQDRLVEQSSKYLDFLLHYDASGPSQVRHQENWSGIPNGMEAVYKISGTDAAGIFQHESRYGYEYDGLARLIRADARLDGGQGKGPGYPDDTPFGISLGTANPVWMGDCKYRYDKAGNITGLWRYNFSAPNSQAFGPVGISWNYQYAPGTNRLASLATGGAVQASLAYDPLGNLVSDSRRELSGLEWDAMHRNVAYAKSNGDSVRHVYGGSGARAYKELNGSKYARTFYFNGPGGQSLAIWNDSTWSFPLYGNGMFGEWSKPQPDSTLARKAGDDAEPEGPKAKGRGKRILRAVRNVALSLVTGAAVVRQEEERQLSPLAVAPAVAALADELFDAKQGDGNNGPPERYASGIKFFVKDYLGNVRVTERPIVVYDSLAQAWTVADSLVSVVDYYPFGRVLRSWYGEGQERWLSTSHERDAESGLDYRGARYYDADYGRFLSLDPLAGAFPSWSAYNYVFDNPVVFVDPTGLYPTGGEQDGGDEEEEMVGETVVKTVTISDADGPGEHSQEFNAWARGFLLRGLEVGTPYGVYAEIERGDKTATGLINLAEMEAHAYRRMATGNATFWEYADQILLFGLGRNVESMVNGWQEADGEGRARMVYDGAALGAGVLKVKPGLGTRNVVSKIPKAQRYHAIFERTQSTRGNFGIGQASSSEVVEIGEMWVGKKYRIASDGRTMVSSDGLRQFRPPSFKQKLGITQANFEWREIPKGRWLGNGHMDIID